MLTELFYLLVSTSGCVVLMLLIQQITQRSITYPLHELVLSLLLSILCATAISLAPTLSLLFKGIVVPYEGHIRALTFHIALLAFICFLTFTAMSYLGKKKLNPSLQPLNEKDVSLHLLLSSFISLFILGYTYFTTVRLEQNLTISQTNLMSSWLLLIGAIYAATRIFQHLHLDQLVIKRELNRMRVLVSFDLIGLSLSSIVFSFIAGLLQHNSLFMDYSKWTSVLLLFVITLSYLEDQFSYQHQQLRTKHHELQINEQEYRSLFQNNPDAIFVLDMKGRFKSFNHSVLELTQYAKDEMLHLNIPDLIVPAETRRVLNYYDQVCHGMEVHFETTFQTKYGREVYIDITAFPIHVNSTITGVYAIVQDITKEKESQQKIEYMAYHDELTGLMNRRGIRQRMEQHIRLGQPHMAFILLDIDLFKDINDHLGHTYGDQLLQFVGARLKKILKESASIARIGGDEFLLCIPYQSDSSEIFRLTDEIQCEMSKPFQLGQHEKAITTSMGISFYPSDGQHFDTLIKHADMAMYEVKYDGRNHYLPYSPAMEKRSVEKIVLLEELQRAIDQQELFLHYHPKYKLSTNKVEGVEVLVRWEHPIKGTISPAEFIPLAEQSNVIHPLGDWIMTEACRQFSEWQCTNDLDFHLSINISPKQFLHPEFAQRVKKIVSDANLQPKSIDLEITETLAMENTVRTMDIMAELKAYGFQVTMDDFGTGYTSLSYLSKFEFDRIKIDRSFIKDLPENSDHIAIVQSLISVAKHLGIQITAEGIETDEQLSFLTKWGCDEGQGYYYTTPVGAEEFMKHYYNNLQTT
ncbi:hypothetical protein N781_14225 [Pontibacillus halophilus JSM 076056 = DSM 19796]|uniref:Diguanylate cyclase n=1 Tax=Pontibacillus halophilus JSM 076056 = DSM 19796 TaxID=1385510 RepID=A0A0A5GPJ4_9BACI|nr:EAL domain-containing protein [Pontibacillus halophilus]KGX93065.1 hypothetical protein N781_14225 [Pontibacillus halophilus JSM 076056 = DSM 19796]